MESKSANWREKPERGRSSERQKTPKRSRSPSKEERTSQVGDAGFQTPMSLKSRLRVLRSSKERESSTAAPSVTKRSRSVSWVDSHEGDPSHVGTFTPGAPSMFDQKKSPSSLKSSRRLSQNLNHLSPKDPIPAGAIVLKSGVLYRDGTEVNVPDALKSESEMVLKDFGRGCPITVKGLIYLLNPDGSFSAGESEDEIISSNRFRSFLGILTVHAKTKRLRSDAKKLLDSKPLISFAPHKNGGRLHFTARIMNGPQVHVYVQKVKPHTETAENPLLEVGKDRYIVEEITFKQESARESEVCLVVVFILLTVL